MAQRSKFSSKNIHYSFSEWSWVLSSFKPQCVSVDFFWWLISPKMCPWCLFIPGVLVSVSFMQIRINLLPALLFSQHFIATVARGSWTYWCSKTRWNRNKRWSKQQKSLTWYLLSAGFTWISSSDEVNAENTPWTGQSTRYTLDMEGRCNQDLDMNQRPHCEATSLFTGRLFLFLKSC